MSGKKIATRVQQQLVKPLLSVDSYDARLRVMKLYKAWHRQCPLVMHEYSIPVNERDVRSKVREQFEKNRHVTDVRVIDMLVIKGQQELLETANLWKQKNHLMNYFKLTEPKKTDDFLTNFYEGQHS